MKRRLSFLLLVGTAVTHAAENAPPKIEYNRDVRPILSDKCFKCHGPDAPARKAKLRLDLRGDAIAQHESGPSIVPGQADQSEVVKRIETSDADEVMRAVGELRGRGASGLGVECDVTDQASLAYCPDLPAVHFDGKAANVTKATICTSVPSSNSGTTESASWVNFGLDALLSAYGAPNQPVTEESCTRVATDPLLVWLTTTEGTLYPVYAPVDKCGYPSAAAIDAYQSAGLQILYEADLDANGQPVNPQ